MKLEHYLSSRPFVWPNHSAPYITAFNFSRPAEYITCTRLEFDRLDKIRSVIQVEWKINTRINLNSDGNSSNTKQQTSMFQMSSESSFIVLLAWRVWQQ